MVALENRLSCPGDLLWLARRTKLKRYTSSSPLLPHNYAYLVAAKTRIQHCLCREVDEIWQYHTGGNLTIFDEDHDTAGSCSQAYSFATITMYSWWQPSEIGCAYRI